jgi:hypothetical protein
MSEERWYREFDACLSRLSLKKRTQCQSKDVIESMNSQFLISPMESRGKWLIIIGVFNGLIDYAEYAFGALQVSLGCSQ